MSRENGSNVSKEAHAYTPGLKVKRRTTVSKTRRLPIAGTVYVSEGDVVDRNTIIAKSQMSGEPEIVNAAMELGAEPRDLPNHMMKKIGQHVTKHEIFASYNELFGLIKKQVVSPIDGAIESISEATGQVVIRGTPVPVEIDAYIPGKVVKVLPKEGAIIETNGAFIQGIFGVGGETHGNIRLGVDAPDKQLTEDAIDDEDHGTVLIGGSLLTLDVLRKAVKTGVSCIIAGGVRHKDITDFMGEKIGVAITGQEELGTTVIVTEGFGNMRMSQRTFDLLRHFEGTMASVNGATQIRAGVMRPEIIIPHDESSESASDEQLVKGIVVGTPVRIIRQPYFGAIGTVVSLPVELQQVESESFVRILGVRLENGNTVTVPRANVEIIEE